MSISIKLPDDAERRLVETAKQLNVRAEDLAAAAVGDLITPSDEAFRRPLPGFSRRIEICTNGSPECGTSGWGRCSNSTAESLKRPADRLACGISAPCNLLSPSLA